MHDLALALVTVGGVSLLEELVRSLRDRAPTEVTPAPVRPGAESPTPRVPRTFDAIFARHGQSLPVAYLRALAWHESRLTPRAPTPRSSATGLLQVVDVVRTDHNRIYGSNYTRDDLNDPVVNVTIAAAAIRRIVDSFARNHRAVPNLVEDWNNYRFVELVTNGWNAGWSERAGVRRVARYLEQLGSTDITVELVHQHARAAGATKHLQSVERLQWAQKVARHYAAERARDAAPMPARALAGEVVVARSSALAGEVVERARASTGNDNASSNNAPITSPQQVSQQTDRGEVPITSPRLVPELRVVES